MNSDLEGAVEKTAGMLVTSPAATRDEIALALGFSPEVATLALVSARQKRRRVPSGLLWFDPSTEEFCIGKSTGTARSRTPEAALGKMLGLSPSSSAIRDALASAVAGDEVSFTALLAKARSDQEDEEEDEEEEEEGAPERDALLGDWPIQIEYRGAGSFEVSDEAGKRLLVGTGKELSSTLGTGRKVPAWVVDEALHVAEGRRGKAKIEPGRGSLGEFWFVTGPGRYLRRFEKAARFDEGDRVLNRRAMDVSPGPRGATVHVRAMTPGVVTQAPSDSRSVFVRFEGIESPLWIASDRLHHESERPLHKALSEDLERIKEKLENVMNGLKLIGDRARGKGGPANPRDVGIAREIVGAAKFWFAEALQGLPTERTAGSTGQSWIQAEVEAANKWLAKTDDFEYEETNQGLTAAIDRTTSASQKIIQALGAKR